MFKMKFWSRYISSMRRKSVSAPVPAPAPAPARASRPEPVLVGAGAAKEKGSPYESADFTMLEEERIILAVGSPDSPNRDLILEDDVPGEAPGAAEICDAERPCLEEIEAVMADPSCRLAADFDRVFLFGEPIPAEPWSVG